MKKLSNIYLNDNELTTIDPEFFIKSKDLSSVFLQQNKIEDISWFKKIFPDSTIFQLDMTNNLAKKLPKIVVGNYLKYLTLN